jgi:type IV pilus assembly protein PilE
MKPMRHRARGFTLLELMATVGIVTILAAIAYPSYVSQVRQSRRAEGTVAIESLAQAQERFYARFRTYTSVVVAPGGCAGAACGLGLGSNMTTNGHYSLTANGTAATYTVTATASGTQVDDSRCRTFTLNNSAVRSATDSGGADSTADCWSR